ncbi:Chromosome partition protein Smc [Carpediemonas membranifera]|uniref:Chromosome partition protein Smc n=1 Tax=Carpediemonas membranifera TaxID=201153 RepID=A0A8J6AVA0_9EUKA|nr:Chromosome partition protein Smc [Carpediemonas membranifera]|eukprot:KAG9395068.1 Chromosome partition protein Smc [Carpediemonas membranifera]
MECRDESINHAFDEVIDIVRANLSDEPCVNVAVAFFDDVTPLILDSEVIYAATVDDILDILLDLCNAGFSKAGVEAFRIFSKLLMSDADLLDRFQPTRSRLMKLDLPRHIMSRDAAVRGLALDTALMLLYHEDTLVIEDITTDTKIKSVIAWTERKRAYRAAQATRQELSALKDTTDSHTATVNSLLVRTSEHGEHLARLRRETDGLLATAEESTAAIRSLETRADTVERHVQRLLQDAAGHGASIDGLTTATNDTRVHVESLTKAYADMSGNLAAVREIMGEFRTALGQTAARLERDLGGRISEVKDTAEGLERRVVGLTDGLERTRASMARDVSDLRQSAERAAVEMGERASKVERAADALGRDVERVESRVESGLDELHRVTRAGDEALGARVGGIETTAKELAGRLQDATGQLNGLTGTVTKHQMSIDNVVAQNKESLKVAKQASSKIADVTTRTLKIAAELKTAQDEARKHSETITGLETKAMAYDERISDVYNRSSQLLSSTQQELQRSQRKIDQTQAFLSTQAEDKLDELARTRPPHSPTVGGGEIDTKLRALQWVARNSAWMDADKITRSVSEFTVWAADHPGVLRATPAQRDALRDCASAIRCCLDAADDDQQAKLAGLLRLLRCILLSEASCAELAHSDPALLQEAVELTHGPDAVVGAVLDALAEACCVEESAAVLLQTPLLDRLLDAVQGSNDDTKRRALLTTRHLARHDKAVERMATHRLTGQLIAMLKSRVPGPVMDQLCPAVRNLCRSEAIVTQLDRAGAVPVLITLLRQAEAGGERAKHVTATLRACSKDVNVQKYLKAEGVLDVLGIRYPLVK